MFSPIALVVGLYREFFQLDLTNTYTALILSNLAFSLAFAVWILRAFFASLPREVEEAAAVDGCGPLGALVRIVLPLSLPGIVTAVISTFIAAWSVKQRRAAAARALVSATRWHRRPRQGLPHDDRGPRRGLPRHDRAEGHVSP